jgi:transposase
MHYVMISGTGSRIFCPVAKVMSGARRRITGHSWKLCCRYRAGIPWRDLPERFGDWKVIYQRFSRWARSGVFEPIFKLLASDHDNEYMMIDATIVRAHEHSAGGRKKTARKRSADPAAD